MQTLVYVLCVCVRSVCLHYMSDPQSLIISSEKVTVMPKPLSVKAQGTAASTLNSHTGPAHHVIQ